MPTYEYSCIECDEDKEVKRGFNDPESAPSCKKGHTMIRVYAPVGVQFKGTGFYKTDNG
jgi:putative FmdB family regulatory protein